MRLVVTISGLLFATSVSPAAAQTTPTSSAPASPATTTTPTEEALKKDLEELEQKNEELTKQLEDAKLPAERFMRHGITVGAAYSVHYGAGDGARLHGLQGGSVMAYVAVFPVYWGSSAGANAYCAAQWSASEGEARSAEAKASEDSKTARHLKVVKHLLKSDKEEFSKRLEVASAELSQVATSLGCVPVSGTPPGDGDWSRWCNGKLEASDLEKAAQDFTAANREHAKKQSDEGAISALTAEAASKKLDTKKVDAAVAATPKAPAQADYSAIVARIHCRAGSLQSIRDKKTAEITADDVRTACRRTLDDSKRPALDALAARHTFVTALQTMNAEATRDIEVALDADWSDRRRALGHVAQDMDDERRRMIDILDAAPATRYPSVQSDIVQPVVTRTTTMKTSQEVMDAWIYLRAAYRAQYMERAADDLAEDREGLPITQPYACLPNKLGAYIGIAAPFDATVYLPATAGGGIVEREVSPLFSWGGVLAPNALFSFLVGASVGTVAREADDGDDSRTEPIFMGTLGLGGNLDLASVIQ